MPGCPLARSFAAGPRGQDAATALQGSQPPFGDLSGTQTPSGNSASVPELPRLEQKQGHLCGHAAAPPTQSITSYMALPLLTQGWKAQRKKNHP